MHPLIEEGETGELVSLPRSGTISEAYYDHLRAEWQENVRTADARLLKILAKRIIVNPDGLIVDQELHSPLPYLRSLAGDDQNPGSPYRDSEQSQGGAQRKLTA